MEKPSTNHMSTTRTTKPKWQIPFDIEGHPLDEAWHGNVNLHLDIISWNPDTKDAVVSIYNRKTIKRDGKQYNLCSIRDLIVKPSRFNQQEFEGWYNAEFRDNFVFTARLTYNGCMEDKDGKMFQIFKPELQDMMENHVPVKNGGWNGVGAVFDGQWTFTKRGYKYGIKFLGQ